MNLLNCSYIILLDFEHCWVLDSEIQNETIWYIKQYVGFFIMYIKYLSGVNNHSNL